VSESNILRRVVRRRPLLFLAVTVLLLVSSVGAVRIVSSRPGSRRATNGATFTVRRGPLRISVIESGTIKPREQVILKSEVEGTTSILWLIPEGTRVKKGDLLVELDASSLLDARIDQQIKVQNAEAAFVSAREELEIVKSQAESDIELAKLTLEFAKQDLKKYLEGEYPTQLKQAQAQITLAEEELQRAEEQLKWSKKLFAEKYISQTELKADELAAKRKALDLQLAKNNLSLLQDFTYKRTLAQLQSDLKQAQMALERVTRKAKANVIQAEANLKAKESEFNRQRDKLKKIEEQIEKTKIYAPADGLVIYATSARRGGWRSSTEPLDVGQTVRQRQELIYLPTTSSVKAEVDIHESSLKKVKVGLPAIVTVDALPGKIFTGKVATIAPLPDAQSIWMNPDLKVYNSDIYLDSNDSALRAGMSCKAEIIVEEYSDAIYVPIQAVLRINGQPTCFVVKDGKLEPRKVKVGLDNNRMIRIISGLKEGEIVSLTPPLQMASVEPSSRDSSILDRHLPGRKQPEGSNVPGAGPGFDGQRWPRDRIGVGSRITPEQAEKMKKGLKNLSEHKKQKLLEKMRQRKRN